MTGKFKKGLALSLVLCALGTMPAGADRLEDIRQQMSEQQTRALEAQKKVDIASQQLTTIQADLDAATAEYTVIKTKLDQTESQMAQNEQQLQVTEDHLAKRSKVLNARVRDVYKNGQLSYLDVLFGSTDFMDLVTRLDLLQRVLRQDVQLVNQVKDEKNFITNKQNELTQQKAVVTQLTGQALLKQQQVESRKREKEAIMRAAMSEKDEAEKSYQDLLETSRQIENMLRGGNYQYSGSVIGTGAMIWPAAGPVTSPFGWRTHPIFGTGRFHSGIDIGASYGDTVVAADNGIVVYADWMGGYGKAVMVDHGSGVVTLYGHNSEILVAPGQSVGKGQAISRVGSTGYSTGPHLHFEVRRNGEPVNPMGYL